MSCQYPEHHHSSGGGWKLALAVAAAAVAAVMLFILTHVWLIAAAVVVEVSVPGWLLLRWRRRYARLPVSAIARPRRVRTAAAITAPRRAIEARSRPNTALTSTDAKHDEGLAHVIPTARDRQPHTR